MSRKTVEAERDFRSSATRLRNNMQQGTLTTDLDLKEIISNQSAQSNGIADGMDGLQKLAAALRDIYDVCARIEARQKGTLK